MKPVEALDEKRAARRAVVVAATQRIARRVERKRFERLCFRRVV